MSIRRAVLASVVSVLAAAPAAHAATVQATPGEGLPAAIGKAAAGDTIVLAAGDYTHADAATIPAAKTGLILDGSAGARIVGPVTVQATGTVLRALTLAPAAAGLTVEATGGATLDRVLGARTAGGDVPVVTSAGPLALTDSTIASTTGDGVAVSGPSTTFVRSTVAASEPASDAVQVSSAGNGDKGVVADSSMFVGGATAGSGLRATTSGTSIALPAPLPSTVIGNIGITLRHVTVAGAAAGLTLASGASGSGGGITAVAAGSIVHPASTLTQSELGGSPATFNASDSDGPGLTQNTPDPQLFAPGFKLRADSPAIGKGGPLADGESRTDLAGQARPATGNDIGAFQFVNGAPTTGLTLSAGVVDEGATITAVLTPSDPDLGDTVPTYAFDWGDGTPQTVGTAATAAHTYATPGVYTIKGAVADARGTPSNVVTGTVTVRDTSAPTIVITSPKAGTKYRFKRSRRVTIAGTDADATGVAKVEVALTRKSGKRCFQYGSKFVKRGCSKLTWKRATLKDQTWSLRTRKRVPLRKGTYTIRVRSVDGIANATAKPTARNGLLRRFVVR